MSQSYISHTPLKPGSIIKVVAPCGPFERDTFEAGLQILESWGLKLRLDDNIFSRNPYLAGSDERRFKELWEGICDPDIQGIWCARGGYGATRLLNNLPVQTPSHAPKWLMGFSDVSALLQVWDAWGWPCVHGANVTTLSGWSLIARTNMWCMLQGQPTPAISGKSRQGQGQHTATVTGGNLTVLAAMTGGRFTPRFKDKILFLEDVGERPYRLDRCFTSLLQAGAFEGLAGLALGQWTQCHDQPPHPLSDPGDGEDIIVTLAKRHCPDIPILSNLEIGHANNSEALLFQHPTTLCVDSGTLVLSPQSQDS
jgi:muramoyltetrapeptide carboxypeptidase